MLGSVQLLAMLIERGVVGRIIDRRQPYHDARAELQDMEEKPVGQICLAVFVGRRCEGE